MCEILSTVTAPKMGLFSISGGIVRNLWWDFLQFVGGNLVSFRTFRRLSEIFGPRFVDHCAPIKNLEILKILFVEIVVDDWLPQKSGEVYFTYGKSESLFSSNFKKSTVLLQ